MIIKENLKLLNYVAIIIFSFSCVLAWADEASDISELKGQINALQKRVEELEAGKDDSSWERKKNEPRRFARDPFGELNRMQEEINRMFQNSFGQSMGRSNIFSNNMNFEYDFDLREKDDGYEFRFDMKGLDKEKLDVEINENSITITGEHSRQDAEESKSRYFRSRSFGSFLKTIPLPVDADTKRGKVEKQDDFLIIRLPKKG